MRFTSAQTRRAWLSSYKGGATQPCARATIEPFILATVPYDGSQIGTSYTTDSTGASKLKAKPRSSRGNFAVGMFNAGRRPKELPNIKSVTFDVSVDVDTGSMTLELWNTSPLPIGQAPVNDETFDLPGYFSAGRGVANEPSDWGNVRNEWQGMLAPDRLIRLYQGYGFDASQPPEKDPYLYPYGLWLIDEVTNNGAIITVQCRDLGRLLMDQIAMPPVIPGEEYPLSFAAFGTTPVAQSPVTIPAPTVIPITPTTPPVDPAVPGLPPLASYAWRRLQYKNDSNKYFVGKSLTNNLGAPLVNPGGDVSGHYGVHAFDSDLTTFWFSVGAKYLTVPRWVEGAFSVPYDCNSISIKPYGGPYNVWISLKSNGVWQGTSRIPYTNGTDYIVTDATIPYVKWGTVPANAQTHIALPVDASGRAVYKGVTEVRVTFTSLKQVGTGDANWHAGCYDIQVSTTPTVAATTATSSTSTTTTTTSSTGATVATAVPVDTTIIVDHENISSYSDIAKWLAAWGGFYWPGGSNSLNSLTYADGTSDSIPGPGVGDPIFPGGRIWGDIEEAGAGPANAIPASQFDKRSLLDGLGFVRDVLGYNLFFSELGGITFRSPNIWSVGNYVSPVRAKDNPLGPANLGRTPDIIDLKDDEHIIGISTVLSSRNIRETVAVGNVLGSLGATALLKTNETVGPHKSDLRRMAVWTDQFSTAKECLIMAELIMLRQAFTYRTTRVTIPANPAIQIDDQVRIWDRMSASTFLYYVAGIHSTLDMREGKWTYDLTTHWLGTDPFSDWAFAPGDLSEETRVQVKVPTAPPTNINVPGGGGIVTTTPGGTASTGGTVQPANYGWFHTTTTTYTQASIAARFQIATTTLAGLNPRLGDPVGPKYQVKVRTNYGPITTPIESVYSTYGWWQATATSYTVASVAGSYGVSVAALRSWNQWLVGNTVTQGQWVQVRSNADPIRTS